MSDNPTLLPALPADPTREIEVDFGSWVTERERKLGRHLVGGVPDYAFSLDLKIRKQLEMVPLLRRFAAILLSGRSALRRALYELEGVSVGPRQLPEVHAMGIECAERLGIPVPQIYVLNTHSTNAFTLATGESDPIIVLHSGLMHAMSPEEIRAIIGHECGHIHNQHGVYNVVWELLANDVAFPLLIRALNLLGPPGWAAVLLLRALAGGTWLVLGRWHRCAEITCDRAGTICSDDPDAMARALGKLNLGAVGSVKGFDIDVFAEQMKIREKSKLAWISELFATHPPPALRAKAAKLFLEADLLRRWRAETLPGALQLEGTGRPCADIDAEIAKFIL